MSKEQTQVVDVDTTDSDADVAIGGIPEFATSADSPLSHASALTGHKTISEIQQEQARQRQSLAGETVLSAEAQQQLDGMTLEELAAEIKEREAKKEELLGKMNKAQAKVNEITAYVDDLRRRYEIASRKSEDETRQEYLEGAKRERVARHQEALQVRGALEAANVGHVANLDALGLGISPVDQAIAAQISSRRQTERREAKQRKASGQ